MVTRALAASRSSSGPSQVGVALALLLAFLPPDTPLLALAPLWLALGSAFVGWNALALTWAGERVHEAHAGAAMGLETSAILCGATVSAPLFGAIVQASGAFTVAWLTLAGVLALAAVLLWIQARRSDGEHASAQRPSTESQIN